MPHDFPVPDTQRLEVLLAQDFAAMREAEPARLNRLEERLVRRLPAGKRQKKPNTISWWIVLLLAGGFASAAWWAGEHWLTVKEPVPFDRDIKSSGTNNRFDSETHTGPATVEQTEEPPDDERKPPVIYWREGY